MSSYTPHIMFPNTYNERFINSRYVLRRTSNIKKTKVLREVKKYDRK